MDLKIIVIHGPNLNLLGKREPGIYGSMTMEQINNHLVKIGKEEGVEVHLFQSNGEGAIIDALHDAAEWANGVVMNAGAYTHYSIAIRDAIAAIKIPVIEVHLSNVHAREEFRHKSVIAPVCRGVVAGFGWRSYVLGLQGLIDTLKDEDAPNRSSSGKEEQKEFSSDGGSDYTWNTNHTN